MEEKIDRKRPRGRPAKGYRMAPAPTINLTIRKDEFPSIEEMAYALTPKELYDKWGIDIPRDLPWPRSPAKGLSQRVGAILETIARSKKKKEA